MSREIRARWFTESGGTVVAFQRDPDGRVPFTISAQHEPAPVLLERHEAIRAAGHLLWQSLDPADWEVVRCALAATTWQQREDRADLEVAGS